MVSFSKSISSSDGRKRQESTDQGKLPFSLKRRKPSRDKWTLIITIGALLATILFLLVAFLVVVRGSQRKLSTDHLEKGKACKDKCTLKLVETIPDVLFNSGSVKHDSIVASWHALLDSAKTSIDIASSYWSLRDADVSGGPYTKYSQVGEAIYKKLTDLAANKGIKIRIVQQVPDSTFPQKDTEELNKLNNVEVRSLDFKKLQNGSSGIIHTKMWIVDVKHVYVGSANMDWRSLTTVKEVGVVSTNCSCVATDMAKIFDAYWLLSKKDAKVPHPWPSQFDTKYNIGNPLQVMDSSGQLSNIFVGSSPPLLCPKNRTQDIDALLYVISKAKSFIYISVMDYIPIILYGRPQRYWGIIDDALKQAAYGRGITIRLLASKWDYSPKMQVPFLKSLKDAGYAAALRNGSIEVKNFVFPRGTMKIPHAFVKHDKYMVTDAHAYIGTSNWVGDYFTNTAGVSYIINQTPLSMKNTAPSGRDNIREKLKDIFLRDWTSKYTQDL